MTHRPSRNAPCPCGSGLKYKSCCEEREKNVPAEYLDAVRRPYPFDPEVRRSLEISSPHDVPAYLESLVASAKLFTSPRAEALMHALRALESSSGAGMVVLPLRTGYGLYSEMRRAQDLLRYLVYEVFVHCREGGGLQDSSMEELKLGDSTVEEFAKLSGIRDCVEAANRKMMLCTVDQGRRLVQFRASSEAARYQALQQEEIVERIAVDEELTERWQGLQSTLKSIVARTRTDASRRMFNYTLNEREFKEFLPITRLVIGSSPTEPLPGTWSVGPYTIDEYRRFCLTLSNWVNLHSVIFSAVSSGLALMMSNSSVLTPTGGEVIELMRRFGDLAPTKAREILRDLTYNPKEVQWTDVQYQPCVPINNQHLALPPSVISGSNFERNLLSIVDRLPWRSREAEALKRDREEQMLERIRAVVSSDRTKVRSRLKLRRRDSVVGDIDALIWNRDGSAALALQLKWLYGPDSVHEVWVHSERYRDGAARHERVVKFLRENMRRIIRDYGLRGLNEDAEVLPIFVTKEDEPLYTAMPKDMPAVRLRDFERFWLQAEEDVRFAYELVCAHWRREPKEKRTREFRRVSLGKYAFDLPQAVLAE